MDAEQAVLRCGVCEATRCTCVHPTSADVKADIRKMMATAEARKFTRAEILTILETQRAGAPSDVALAVIDEILNIFKRIR
jgi:hypothetical protein